MIKEVKEVNVLSNKFNLRKELKSLISDMDDLLSEIDSLRRKAEQVSPTTGERLEAAYQFVSQAITEVDI